MANYPFPNENINLGTSGRFIRDLQEALNIAQTGVYDFLTMAKVVVHKFEHGLNHQDPNVDQLTWNSIFNRGEDQGGNDRGNNNRDDRGGAAATPGVATVGQINRAGNTDNNGGDDNGNPRATTTGVTNATDENIATNAQPETNPDKPREDQPTVTAADQARTEQPAGGFTAAPTDTVSNQPSPPEAAAGATSAETPNEPGGTTAGTI
jgi:hypothetical protein